LAAQVWAQAEADIEERSVAVIALTVAMLDAGGLSETVKPNQSSFPPYTEIRAGQELDDGQGRTPKIIHSIGWFILPVGYGRCI